MNNIDFYWLHISPEKEKNEKVEEITNIRFDRVWEVGYVWLTIGLHSKITFGKKRILL